MPSKTGTQKKFIVNSTIVQSPQSTRLILINGHPIFRFAGDKFDEFIDGLLAHSFSSD